jgi:hypothetical protein
MASVKEFNDTLFELTDEMLTIIKPSTVMTTAYTVFKNMYTANSENDMALNGFWDVAKDNKDVIMSHDVSAMADVLRSLIPMPGLVDDVLNALSDENRGIVADYISVLYDQASAIKANAVESPPKEESGSTTMYSMYNDIWRDFLVLLESNCTDADTKGLLAEAREKLESVLETKGPTTEIIFAVLYPSMQGILPTHSIASEADIIRLCMPPSDVSVTVKKNIKSLHNVLFPFNRKLPFSDMLKTVAHGKDREKLGTFWHYIKLFTLCVNDCPPEIVGMMNQMVAFFNQDSTANFLLREAPAVFTK